MSISKATTDLSTLKINVLTEQMYKDALNGEEIEANELYVTPFDCGYVVEESSTILLSGTYEITDLNEYYIYDYDGILIYFNNVADEPDYIDSDYLKVTLSGETYIFPKIDNDDGNNGTPYACYNIGYGGSIDWSNGPFVVHLYDSQGTKVKTSAINIYIQLDHFTSPVSVTIEDYNQTITTTPDFNVAVSHVLETNLQSVEGGSY